MQIDTTAEFTHALNEESKEPSKTKESQTAQRVRTYRQRHADGDQDSGAEDMVPSSKRNKTEGMNLNSALKQARKKRKEGVQLTQFEQKILRDKAKRDKARYKAKKDAEFLSEPQNMTPMKFYNEMEQLK